MLFPSPSDAALSWRGLRYAAFMAIGYFLLAWFGMSLPGKSGYSSYIWPAAGFAVGFMLRAPRHHWPLLALTIYAVGVVNGIRAGYPLWENLLNAISPLMALINASALHFALRGRPELDTMRRVAIFTVTVVIATAAVSFLGGLFTHLVMGKELLQEWRTWFIADSLGILLLAPLVLAWTRPDRERLAHHVAGRKAEIVLLYVGLVASLLWVYTAPADPYDANNAPTYLCIPFLIWAALRFGQRGTTLALVTFAFVTLWYTARGFGPYAAIHVPMEEAALRLQSYLAAITIMVFFGGALMSERQRAQRENASWRRRYEAAIEASGSLVFDINPRTGSILWAGDTTKLLGIAKSNIDTVRGWTARVHEQERHELLGLRARLASGELQSIVLEYRVRRDDNVYITIGVNAYSIEGEDGDNTEAARHIIGFVKDITEAKRVEQERHLLEEKLKQAQKMEAIGRLAGGIAHDFNNILGAILGYGEMAQKKVAPESDLRRYVDTILAAGERGKALVAQILTFSRAKPAEKQPVLVVALMEEVAALLQGSLPQTIRLNMKVSDRGLMVLGEVTQLHQLVMNLCTNAVQAMPEGGELSLHALSCGVDTARVARLGSLAPGRYVAIEVTDTGAGIDAETQARMFEPFFTTKPTGRGTGLGLALAQSIALAHGGALDVQSAPGAGSTFTVFLPELTAQAVTQVDAEDDLPHGHGETVLVVDDEEALQNLAEEMLAELGYEPVGFHASEAALAAFEADPARFDLILTDEVMPRLTGTELTARIRETHPRIPVLLISGYGGPGFEIRAQSAGVTRMLQKPYHKRELAEALAAALATARTHKTVSR